MLVKTLLVSQEYSWNWKSNLPEVFLRKGVLKIYSKFREEHLCRSVISINLLCNFIEIRLRHGCSPVNLLRKNTSRGLLLNGLVFAKCDSKLFFTLSSSSFSLWRIGRDCLGWCWVIQAKKWTLNNICEIIFSQKLYLFPRTLTVFWNYLSIIKSTPK